MKEPINATTPHHQFSQDVHNMVQRSCLKMYKTFIKVKKYHGPIWLNPYWNLFGCKTQVHCQNKLPSIHNNWYANRIGTIW